MFWNRKQKNDEEIFVRTIITKTSSQAKSEKEIKHIAELQSTTCPCCGHVSDDSCTTFPQEISGTNINVLHSECVKCGTEWKVQYKLY